MLERIVRGSSNHVGVDVAAEVAANLWQGGHQLADVRRLCLFLHPDLGVPHDEQVISRLENFQPGDRVLDVGGFLLLLLILLLLLLLILLLLFSQLDRVFKVCLPSQHPPDGIVFRLVIVRRRLLQLVAALFKNDNFFLVLLLRSETAAEKTGSSRFRSGLTAVRFFLSEEGFPEKLFFALRLRFPILPNILGFVEGSVEKNNPSKAVVSALNENV